MAPTIAVWTTKPDPQLKPGPDGLCWVDSAQVDRLGWLKGQLMWSTSVRPDMWGPGESVWLARRGRRAPADPCMVAVSMEWRHATRGPATAARQYGQPGAVEAALAAGWVASTEGGYRVDGHHWHPGWG